MIIQCPSCSGPLLRDAKISASLQVGVEVSFSMKCPHCQKPTKVRFSNMGMQVFVNDKMVEKVGEEGGASIRTLSS